MNVCGGFARYAATDCCSGASASCTMTHIPEALLMPSVLKAKDEVCVCIEVYLKASV